jgi:hypothetical protein
MLDMSIQSGLAAHFRQAEGPSLQGVSWLVRIDRDGQTHHARVKALLAPSATRATRKDEAYQAQTSMQYLADEIERGWNPADEREHTIHIGNPVDQRPQPWWKFW